MLITLEAARVNSGYKLQEAAKLLGIHYQTLSSLEKDSTNISFSLIKKASKLYNFDSDKIFLGNKNEFIRCMRRKEKEAST